MPWEETSLKTMHIRFLGSPSSPPLVFLHGFMGSGEDWILIANGLSQDFYCLLPDLPGHGNTPLDADPGYESWTIALKKMILEKNIQKAGWIGYSLGGRLALHFTLTCPEMVTQLVLESANPGINDPKERQQRIQWDEALAKHIHDDGL